MKNKFYSFYILCFKILFYTKNILIKSGKGNLFFIPAILFFGTMLFLIGYILTICPTPSAFCVLAFLAGLFYTFGKTFYPDIENFITQVIQKHQLNQVWHLKQIKLEHRFISKNLECKTKNQECVSSNRIL